MRKRKSAKDHNRRSGNNRIDIEFEEECAAIAARDDSIEPEVVRGVGYVRKKGDFTTTNSNSTTTSSLDSSANSADIAHFSPSKTVQPKPKIKWAKKKTATQIMKETLLQIEARREARSAAIEQRREQRHKEKMDLLRQILESQNKNTD